MAGSRAIDLEIISENSRDETGFNDRVVRGGGRSDLLDSCENLGIDDTEGIQKPQMTQGHRQTIVSEMTNNFDFDQQSSDEDDEYLAPWFDHVKLRHGMDWLDLITNEVDSDTMRVNATIMHR